MEQIMEGEKLTRMGQGITPSEKFVNGLCERSFLKLWTHPNPKGKKGKELCDCLIVCGPNIVIISVKEIQYKDSGNKTGWERWTKDAIEKSSSQIWGAERWLETVEQIERYDGRIITLPPKNIRHYYRISVSLGSKGQVPIKCEASGKGFIHLCDEYSVGILFNALDTITDFVEFLEAVEMLIKNGVKLIFNAGGLEDLVALYIQSGYTFDIESSSRNKFNMLMIENDIWKGFSKSNEYKAIQVDFKNSYTWDYLIEYHANYLLTGKLFDMYSKKVTDNELALVTMALQPRRYRATLADAFLEFFQKPELKIASRAIKGYNNTAFVFLAGKSSNREYRGKELVLRCLVIRGKSPEITTVVGIATDRPGTSEIGYSSDIVYVHRPEWTENDEKNSILIQKELGYFKNFNWNKQK